MPKSVALTSHEAIKRSLKSKFKLILSENRILVETINGYVRKAEKVYKEMESTEAVTPKQFAKAMEKLERAYSACVRLIMVASDLFEKGDMDNSRTRDLAPSSCESETSAYSSESSTTMTDSNRARKIRQEKIFQRRSKSSDSRTQEMKTKAKSQLSNQRHRTIELADTSKAEISNAASERLVVHPGSGSDVDHLIELQRFLHGLEREKLQTEHPSPCMAPEKHLMSYKIQSEKVTAFNQTDPEYRQASPEESPSQSLTQRLKILKNAIEHFKDRSLGDERVTHALNDIRELVLKSREPKEVRQEQLDAKESFLSQTSMVSESISTDLHQDVEQKDSSKDKVERADSCREAHVGDQRNDAIITGKTSPPLTGNLEQGSVDGKPRQKSPLTFEWNQKNTNSQQQQLTSDQQRSQERQEQTMAKKDMGCIHEKCSPLTSPQLSDDGKDDINQIIVNKIVDMVSAKLAPRLQIKNADVHRRSRHVSNTANVGQEAAFPKRAHSPQLYICQDITFPASNEQSNCCGNYNHVMQIQRRRYQQHNGQPQHQELKKPQLRHQRPKMVSFVEDYERASPYNTWGARAQNNTRPCARSSPSSRTSSPFVYSDCERPEHPAKTYKNHQGTRPTSPHKKRLYTIPIPPSSQRYNEQHQQQQCSTSRRQLLESGDVNNADIDAEVDKDEDESDRAMDSDSDVLKEYSEYQSESMHSNAIPSRQPVTWRSRSVPRSPSFLETEYRSMQLSQRGQMYHQQKPLHKTDFFVHRLSTKSPSADVRQNRLKDPYERKWLSPVVQPVDYTSVDESKPQGNDEDTVSRAKLRLMEKSSNENRQGNSPVGLSNSGEEDDGMSHKQLSPNPLRTERQLHTEAGRQLPTKNPRSSTPQSQSQQPCDSYDSINGGQSGYSKSGNNDAMFVNSESSCEASPVYNQDVRSQPGNISISANLEDPDITDQDLARPEVVCIDASQLHADASRTITLSNLPLDMEETELLNIFKKYGHVTKIYYIKDRNTGVFQGRAYGKFSKASEAYQAAQELQNLVIDDNEISVQLYINTPS